MDSKEAAAILRGLAGWTVGTRLRGTEGKGTNWENTSIIEITAIGEEMLVAKKVENNGVAVKGRELDWSLDSRRWRRVR